MNLRCIAGLIVLNLLLFSCSPDSHSDRKSDNPIEALSENELKTGISNYYLPPELSFISWDFPAVAHTGIDIDYKLTGYDWFNRTLSWSVIAGPQGMTIDGDGILHWTASEEGVVDVSVQLALSETEALTKSFSITVDNSRVIFIAPDGSNETGDGTLENPYAYLGETVAKHIVQLGDNAMVYHRGGTYSDLSWTWFDSTNFPNMRQLNILQPGSDKPIILRNYPGENPVLELAGYGLRIYQSHWIYYGLEISGGTGSEGAGLVVFGESSAKRMKVHGYQQSFSNNPTGILASGGVILDQVIAWDNYDRNESEHHNSSNFLFYGEKVKSDKPAFFIDCLSLGYSATGFKVKHAGDEALLHIHKSADINTRRPIAMAQNHNSVRHSFFYSEYDNGVINLGITDPTTNNETHTNGGMLFENNLIIAASESGYTVGHAHWAMNQDPVNPMHWKNNTILSRSSVNGNLFVSARYTALAETWSSKFEENKVYSPSLNNAIILGQKTNSIEALFDYSDGNQTLDAIGSYEFTIAGQTFTITDGILQ